MRILSFSFALFLGLTTTIHAQTLLYSAEIKLNFANQTAVAPLEVFGEEKDGSFILSGHLEITDASKQAAAALEQEINAKGDCEERWSAWDTQIGVEGNALSIGSTIRVEKWFCSLGKTRLARETGRLEARVAPSVEAGVLKLKLVHFRIRDLGSLARALNVEDYVRREVQKEIDQVNANEELERASLLLADAQYKFHETDVTVADNGRARFVVSVIGPDSALSLAKLVSALRSLAE